MAIVTDAWSETDPLGTDGANTIDDAMQRLERRIRERANQGSHYWNNSTLARAGRHCLGTGGGIVGDGTDGEFSLYDEDVVTKIFRLCNNNAAIAAADRQALILNWAVIKNLLLSGFVDGASTVFNLDTQVALTNVAGKLFRLANAGVEKLALDKDGLFLTPNVGSAGIVVGAVGQIVADDDTVDYTITGAYVAIPNTSIVITPFSTSSILLILATVMFENTSNNPSTVFVRIKNGAAVLHEATTNTSTVTGEGAELVLQARQTGLSGAQTYTVEIMKTQGSPVVKNTTDRKARITVIELKR